MLETGTSAHDAAIHVAYVSCEGFDELAEATSGWDFNWRQLDRGPLSAQLLQVATPSLQVSRFSLSRKFHQRGASPPGMRSFGIVNEQSSPVEWRGGEGATSGILIFPAADEYECVSHTNFRGDAVSISEDRIRSVAETLGVPNPLEKILDAPSYAETDTGRLAALRRNLTALHKAAEKNSDLPLSATALSDLEFEIQAALVAALSTGIEFNARSPNPTLRSRALRLAVDYIEEHADGAPAVTDICGASGVSHRTLNHAFHEHFGISPKQYLQAVRLDGVRKELYRKGPSARIADIANTWGFWHLGQFAADYRRQFGELPSETLAHTHPTTR